MYLVLSALLWVSMVAVLPPDAVGLGLVDWGGAVLVEGQMGEEG